MEFQPEKVTIRRARIEDVPAVKRLIKPHVAARRLLPRTTSELQLLIPNGFSAEWEELLVGFVAVEVYSQKLAEIVCLAVDSGYQGQGVGKKLVQACVEFTRQRKILELMAISASEGFLRDCGFDYSLPDQKRALFISTGSRYPSV